MLWVLSCALDIALDKGVSGKYILHENVHSTHNMFFLTNKKNINNFWLKKVPYLELCCNVYFFFMKLCTDIGVMKDGSEL